MKSIPRWLKPYYQVTDEKKFSALIEKIEAKTQAELIPLIVHSSMDRPLVLMVFVPCALFLTVILAPPIHHWLPWEAGLSLPMVEWGLGLLLLLVAWLAAQSPRFLNLIFSKRFLHYCVYRRACLEFFENNLHLTENHSAILFMYSVLERKAMIIADPHLKNIPENLWNSAIQKMLEGAKRKSFFEGFSLALDLTANELARLYPPHEINKNEFLDKVIIKD